MNPFDDTSTPAAKRLLASLRETDLGLPKTWADALTLFEDRNQQRMQDRTLRALVVAYREDKRAGPIIIAMLWRRLLGRHVGADELHDLVVAVLLIAKRADPNRPDLPARIISSAAHMVAYHRPHVRLVALGKEPIAPTPEDPMNDDNMTPAEVMKRLRISRDTLIRYTKAGKIPAIRLPSGRFRYSMAEVDKACTDTAGKRIAKGGQESNGDGTDEGSG